jgi:tetratricopeptide (TPR) repeat protein
MTAALFEPWTLVALCVGVGLLVGLAVRLTLTDGAPAEPRYRLADLDEAYQQTVEQLRDLQEREHRLVPASVAPERARLEARAVALLRELEVVRQAPAPKLRAGPARAAGTPSLVAALRARPRLQGLLWGVGVSACATFLMTTVRQDSTVVPTQAPPPFAAPADGPGPGGAPGIDRARLAVLQGQIEKNPDDVPALLELGHMLLRVQMLDEAQVVNDRALTLDPHSLEGLTHAAVLTAGRGDAAGGQVGLKAVLNKDPGFAEAWFFRGMMGMQAGDMDLMQQSFTQFIRYAPDGQQKERVRAMLERSRTTPG